MIRREVFEMTAESAGFKLGSGVRGKGTQVYKNGKLVGYVSLSRYDHTCKYSMQDFVVDLFDLVYVCDEIYTDYGDPANIIDIDKVKDYEIVHGYGRASEDLEVHFDGRVWEYNEWVLSEFWRNLGDPFESIDPNDLIVVYHRKGKDWYVSPYIELEEVEVYFYDDNNREIDSIWASVYYHEKGAVELVDKALEILKAMKHEVEVKSTIMNNLGIGNEWVYNPDLYEDSIFNLSILKKEYDLWDLAFEFFDWVEWDLDMDPLPKVQRMYEEWLESKLDDREYLFGKYKHLPMVKELFRKNGIEIEKDFSETIKRDVFVAKMKLKGVELDYHFMLKEVYDYHPKKFVDYIMTNIKNKYETAYKEKIVRENAKKVFVGIQDSIKGGNCRAGTMDFVSKHKIDTKKIGGIRGDVLLAMADSNYEHRHAMNAVLAALKRIGIMEEV